MHLITIPAITAAIGILILGIFLILEITSVPVDTDILKRTPLKPGTAEWNRWLNRTATWSVYFFNTTNPDQVALGEKPKLKEFGPYVYEVTETKISAKYDAENETVSFATSTIVKFLPSQSTGSEYDEFLLPNMPLIHLTRVGYDEEVQKALRAHPQEKQFMTMNVAEILYTGKHSPLLKTFYKGTPVLSRFHMIEMLRLDGFYSQNNATSEVQTGNVHSLEDIGKITRWIGKDKIPQWDGACGKIKGTDGTIFQPHVNKDQDYFVYFSHFLRSVYFQYNKETSTEDISGRRYDLPQQLLEYPGVSDENLCFCKAPDQAARPFGPVPKVDCPYNGTLSFRSSAAVDISLSFPHFLHGDPKLHTMVEGTNPDPARHQSYLEIEPESGLILSSSLRMQCNLDFLNPGALNISHFSNFSETVYPMLWFDRHVTDLNDPLLKKALQGPRSLGDTAFGSARWLLLFLGIFMIVGSITWVLCEYYDTAGQSQSSILFLLRSAATRLRDSSIHLTS